MGLATRQRKWTVFQKQTFDLTSTNFLHKFTFGARQKSKYNYINIKTTRPDSHAFVCNFLSFDSRVFIFIVVSILCNKLNSVSSGICLSFKSRHWELFCKIIIQLSSTGIYQGLWLRGAPCSFTEHLFFFYSSAWLLSII